MLQIKFFFEREEYDFTSQQLLIKKKIKRLQDLAAEEGGPVAAGRAPAPIHGAQVATPTLKPLFLSELSDLPPSWLWLGEAGV